MTFDFYSDAFYGRFKGPATVPKFRRLFAETCASLRAERRLTWTIHDQMVEPLATSFM